MTWQETLKRAGFPAPVMVIDFETYYDSEYHLGKDAKALSVAEYVTDPRFEFHGFGLRILNHKWESLGRRFIPKPKIYAAMKKLTGEFGDNFEGCTVVAANGKFDFLILAEKFGLYPSFTVDVEDLVRFYDARMETKLRKAGPYFGLPSKGDTLQFKGKHFEEIDLAAMSAYCLNDIEIEEGLFKRLLLIVQNPEIELRLAAHTLGLYLKPRIVYDFELAKSLKVQMREQIDLAVKDALPYLNADDPVKQLSGDLSFVRLLLSLIPAIPTKPGKPSKNMIPLTGVGRIPALAKTDDGLKELLNHSNETVRALTMARVAVSSWPNHISRINKMERQARASGGLVRVPLKYYGAHTGRWSGEEGVNLGNLGGAGRGKAINKLIGQVRHTMRAPDLDTLILCDAEQVEARDLAKYAEQVDLVQGFAQGQDIYSEFATDLFQKKVWKPADDDDSPEAKRATIDRGFGKDAVLGCGYGMGADKFYERCLANETLRPLFDSGEYDRDFIGRLIKTYRTKYSCIPEFWGRVERAWRLATKYGNVETVGQLCFWHKAGTTFLQLPSGRILRYRHARVTSTDELRYHDGSLWGGSLTENIVQATCRDYLAYWILRIEDELHCPVVHHVYDETITLVSLNEAEQRAKEIKAIMSTGPAWAVGMPFAAKASISPFYKK